MTITYSYDNYRIKGEDFFNYYTCKTRFWLQHKNISGDFSNNEHIKIGKFLDSYSFLKNKKELIIDGVCQLDFIKKTDKLEIHEIKKGKNISEPQIMQVEYYIKILKELTDMEVVGYIHLVQIRKKFQIEYDENKINITLQEMTKILDGNCPKPLKIPVCKGCSYMEICWS